MPALMKRNLVAANTYRPGRPLTILGLLIAVLVALVYWPFSDASSTPQLGLDLRGGTSVTLLASPINEGEVTQDQVDQAVDIIRQRVDGLGVAEAEVTTQTSDEGPIIIVSVPGVSQSRIVELVGQTAQLNFRPVLVEAGGGATPTPTATPRATPKATPKATLPIQSPTNDAAFQAKFAALDCTQDEVRVSSKPDNPDEFLITCSRDGGVKYLLDKAVILGTNIENASANLSTQGVGQWVVNLDFDGEGTQKFAEATAQLNSQQPPQNQFAIVLDGLVVSAPSVSNGAITGGQAEISGSFTQADAQDLASVLKFGALPLAFEIQEVESISATLGSDQLQAGLIAAGLGLLLVVLFLMLYYRALGLVAVFSLLLVGVLTYLSFVVLGRTVGFTLTLAGVTGAIVAIGVTADSFIIYFERIRDELRDGKTMRVAADEGWAKARRTILAADFVSLLAALVLYFVSVGNVRGFAFVLGLTTLLDVLVVFLFTRPIITVLAQRQFFAKGHRLSGVDQSRLSSENSARNPAAPVSAATASKES
jgi:preprotein translocase subunit SecD